MVLCNLLEYVIVLSIVIPCASSSPQDIKMWKAYRTHTRFQVKKNDVDSLGTCITGEIVLRKWKCAIQNLQKLRSLKRLRKSPLTCQELTNMIGKLEGNIYGSAGKRTKESCNTDSGWHRVASWGRQITNNRTLFFPQTKFPSFHFVITKFSCSFLYSFYHRRLVNVKFNYGHPVF